MNTENHYVGEQMGVEHSDDLIHILPCLHCTSEEKNQHFTLE